MKNKLIFLMALLLTISGYAGCLNDTSTQGDPLLQSPLESVTQIAANEDTSPCDNSIVNADVDTETAISEDFNPHDNTNSLTFWEYYVYELHRGAEFPLKR